MDNCIELYRVLLREEWGSSAYTTNLVLSDSPDKEAGVEHYKLLVDRLNKRIADLEHGDRLRCIGAIEQWVKDRGDDLVFDFAPFGKKRGCYVVSFADDSSLFKVGYADDVAGRVRELSLNYGLGDASLVTTIKSKSMPMQKLERVLHGLMSPFRGRKKELFEAVAVNHLLKFGRYYSRVVDARKLPL